MLVLSLFVYFYNFIMSLFVKRFDFCAIFFFYSPYFLLLIFFGWVNLQELSKDYYLYYDWFNYIKNSQVNFLSDKDPLFQYLSIFLMNVFNSIEYVFLFFISLSVLLKFFIGIKFFERQIIWLYFILVFCRFYILHDLTQIRASLAISLCMIGYYFFINKKKKYIFLFILAFLFHKSTLVFILPLLVFKFLNIYKSKLFNLVVLSFSPLLYFLSSKFSTLFFGSLNDDRLSVYSDGNYSQNSEISIFSFYVLLKFFILIINYYFWSKMSDYEKKFNFFVALGLLFQMLFSSNGVLGWRFSEIFAYFDIFCLIMVLKFLKPNDRFLYFIFCILLSILMLYATSFSKA